MADWARGGLYRYTVAVQDEPEEEDLKQKKVQMMSSHHKNLISSYSVLIISFIYSFLSQCWFSEALHQKYFRAEGQPSPEDTDSGVNM